MCRFVSIALSLDRFGSLRLPEHYANFPLRHPAEVGGASL